MASVVSATGPGHTGPDQVPPTGSKATRSPFMSSRAPTARYIGESDRFTVT